MERCAEVDSNAATGNELWVTLPRIITGLTAGAHGPVYKN